MNMQIGPRLHSFTPAENTSTRLTLAYGSKRYTMASGNISLFHSYMLELETDSEKEE